MKASEETCVGWVEGGGLRGGGGGGGVSYVSRRPQLCESLFTLANVLTVVPALASAWPDDL